MASSANEKEIEKLTKLLEEARLENKAIREAYIEEQDQDKQEYEKRIASMYEMGYQQALRDVELAEEKFAQELEKPSEEGEK